MDIRLEQYGDKFKSYFVRNSSGSFICIGNKEYEGYFRNLDVELQSSQDWRELGKLGRFLVYIAKSQHKYARKIG